MKTKTLLPLIAVGLTTISQAAFITDISAWSRIGDGGLLSDAATVTTAISTGTDDPTNLNVSGNDPVTDSDLETFTMINFFANGYTVNEGSALKQTFSVLAGDTISFDWQYLTNEATSDFAFASLDGTFILLTESASAANVPAFGFSRSVSGTYTSAPFAVDSTVTLAIGVAETDDFSISSGLRIPTIIPEPSASAIVCLAALVVGARRRRG